MLQLNIFFNPTVRSVSERWKQVEFGFWLLSVFVYFIWILTFKIYSVILVLCYFPEYLLCFLWKPSLVLTRSEFLFLHFVEDWFFCKKKSVFLAIFFYEHFGTLAIFFYLWQFWEFWDFAWLAYHVLQLIFSSICCKIIFCFFFFWISVVISKFYAIFLSIGFTFFENLF